MPRTHSFCMVQNCMHTFQKHTGPVLSVCRLDSRTLASASSDETLKIWDFTTAQYLHTLQGHTRSVYAVCRLDAHTLARASSDEPLKILDFTTDHWTHELGLFCGSVDWISAPWPALVSTRPEDLGFHHSKVHAHITGTHWSGLVCVSVGYPHRLDSRTLAKATPVLYCTPSVSGHGLDEQMLGRAQCTLAR